MASQKPAEFSASQRIDAACARFRADWLAGGTPRIEDLLAGAEATDRDSLFRALLAVELDIRVKRRERVVSAEYKTRFPDRAAAVVDVFRALAEKRKAGSGDTSVAQESVMAFVAGKSLADALKDRKEPMPARQAVLIVRKLALALEAAHAKGVVHRDLKPANIMFDRERKDVVVMDFGLARRAAKNEAELTLSGMILGTDAGAFRHPTP